jgi:hypothetical protein
MAPTKQLTKLVVHVKLVCTNWPSSAVKIQALFGCVRMMLKDYSTYILV